MICKQQSEIKKIAFFFGGLCALDGRSKIFLSQSIGIDEYNTDKGVRVGVGNVFGSIDRY